MGEVNTHILRTTQEEFKWKWSKLRWSQGLLENQLCRAYSIRFTKLCKPIYPTVFEILNKEEIMPRSNVAKLQTIPRLTLLKGLPLANMILSPTIENASSGVHSANKQQKILKTTREIYSGMTFNQYISSTISCRIRHWKNCWPGRSWFFESF